jgi:hypothetical protein
MPLIRNKNKATIGKNIAELEDEKKPKDQAVAIALEVAREEGDNIPKKKNIPAKARAKKKEDSVKAILKFLEEEENKMPQEEEEDEDLSFLF